MANELRTITLDSEAVWAAFPPEPMHPAKRTLFDAVGGRGRTPRGPLRVSRFRPGEIGPLGAVVPLCTVEGPFAYPSPDDAFETWHVNFADDHLFAFWTGRAFGQDEIQVAEHPVLASLRQYLLSLGDPELPPLTREHDAATPILVHGATRFALIDTDPPLAEPFGIYGRSLLRASEAALRQAVALAPEGSRTNIIAMAAPRGSGAYTEAQIDDVITSAVTGFAAAASHAPPSRATRVWTGHWGTGAFGGDRLLNATAQLLAARFAGLGELVFCSVDEGGTETLRRAETLAATFSPGTSKQAIVTALHAARFVWGSPDGN